MSIEVERRKEWRSEMEGRKEWRCDVEWREGRKRSKARRVES